MKRFLISVAICLSVMPIARAADRFYINNGIVAATFPPQPAPVIDAINFVNNGFFGVSNFFTGSVFQPEEPFTTSDTLNYTNHNLMEGDSGFRLDLFDTASGRYRRSANFVNTGLINPANALVFGATYVKVAATNIVNRGTLEIGASGLMNLTGDNLDLTRSRLLGDTSFSFGGFNVFNGFGSFGTGGIQDLYWGVDTNILDAVFTPNFVVSSSTLVTNSSFQTNSQQIFLTTFDTYSLITQNGPTNRDVDVLFLSQTNPLVSTEVSFFQTVPGQEKTIRFTSYLTNRATGIITTNTLYFDDNFAQWAIRPQVVPTFQSNRRFFLNANATYRPINYTISKTFFGFNFGTPITPAPLDATIFDGTNAVVYSTNAAYGALILGYPFTVDSTVQGATFTNQAGRIELVADKVLDLTRTMIEGESFLLLNATNHFVGSYGAHIVAPVSDIRLATTNSVLSISNLIYPVVPDFGGTIDAWSGRWTNVNNAGVATRYNVTIVDANLVASTDALVEDLYLRAPTIYISDVLNVFQSLLIDAERLTITTNAANAPVPEGQLNLLSTDFIWSANFPRLAYLTNFGQITANNSLFLAGARTPPWFSGTFDEPYQALVSHGTILANGIDIWANYLELSGSNSSGVGPFTAKFTTGVVTNSTETSVAAGITFTGSELLISNVVLDAAGPITFDITGYLNDGSLGTPIASIRGTNIWTTTNGINYLERATYASLLATTITNTAFTNANVLNQWAAADRGCNPGGFVNNAAIGHLVLNGEKDSVFTFAGTTGNNALYVGTLELNDDAARRNGTSDFPGVQAVGLRIYFGQAFANGLPISEKLNGANSNTFCWVPTFSAASVALTQVVPLPGTTNAPPGTGNNGGGSTAANGAPLLHYPGASTSGTGTSPNPFLGAKGTYNGLIYDTNGISVQSSGYLSVSTTDHGAYAGKLTLGTKTYAVSGQLDNQGTGSKVIPRAGLLPLTLNLVLDLNGGDQLRGSLGGAQWTAEFIADKQVFNKSKNPAPQKGHYTLVIPPSDIPGTGPAGAGFGTVTVDAGGNVQLSASLSDGTKITQKSALSRQGIWPLYVPVYGGSGSVLSWLQFTNQADNDLSGQFVWIKGPSAGAKYFASGFTNGVKATGSAYTAPSKGKKALEISAATLTLTDGNLTQALSLAVTLNSNNKVSGPAASKLVLNLTPSTGLFKGSVMNADTGKPVSFQGVLFQKSSIGIGYFLGSSASGEVRLEAAE